ncbi:MAG: enoyl-CoA hydratase/isomerase family protein [Bdellovibrionales bacterium]|nr:enoyl-CoA hydratase/isomerase family protein [Bdellovibrionales bacterium]
MMDLFLAKRDQQNIETITLNRPELHNAFNDELIGLLTKKFESLNQDKNLRAVILTGEGKSFCAGADLNWMKAMKDYTAEENYKDSQALAGLFETINNCPVPVIARVNGAALGGGAGLIAVCDIVIAVKKAKLGFTEAKLGLLPAVISPFVVAKIGESHARATFLTGEMFSSDRAVDMGLVHIVCEPEELDQKVAEQVQKILESAPQASREAKQLIKGLMGLWKKSDYTPVKDYTCKTISRIRIGAEAQEGMNALLDKRKPNWIEESRS